MHISARTIDFRKVFGRTLKAWFILIACSLRRDKIVGPRTSVVYSQVVPETAPRCKDAINSKGYGEITRIIFKNHRQCRGLRGKPRPFHAPFLSGR